MREDIKHRLAEHNDQGLLGKLRFHVMELNFWVDDDDHLTPCEISIVEFSLEGGVANIMHALLHPGPIPSGFRSEYKENADKTHGITLENTSLTGNYRAVWANIKSMLSCVNGDDAPAELSRHDVEKCEDLIEKIEEIESKRSRLRLMPVYVMPSLRDKALKAMKWLATKTGDEVSVTKSR